MKATSIIIELVSFRLAAILEQLRLATTYECKPLSEQAAKAGQLINR